LTFVQFTEKNNPKYRQILKNVQNTKDKNIKNEQIFTIKNKKILKKQSIKQKNCGAAKKEKNLIEKISEETVHTVKGFFKDLGVKTKVLLKVQHF
jgi:hypothetical protein